MPAACTRLSSGTVTWAADQSAETPACSAHPSRAATCEQLPTSSHDSDRAALSSGGRRPAAPPRGPAPLGLPGCALPVPKLRLRPHPSCGAARLFAERAGARGEPSRRKARGGRAGRPSPGGTGEGGGAQPPAEARGEGRAGGRAGAGERSGAASNAWNNSASVQSRERPPTAPGPRSRLLHPRAPARPPWHRPPRSPLLPPNLPPRNRPRPEKRMTPSWASSAARWRGGKKPKKVRVAGPRVSWELPRDGEGGGRRQGERKGSGERRKGLTGGRGWGGQASGEGRSAASPRGAAGAGRGAPLAVAARRRGARAGRRGAAAAVGPGRADRPREPGGSEFVPRAGEGRAGRP